MNLNLIYKTLDWGKKLLVDLNAEKTQLFAFNWSNSPAAIDVKIHGFVLGEKSVFKMLRLSFSSYLDWSSYIISVGKTTLIGSVRFLNPKSPLYLYEFALQPSMQYCRLFWAGALSCSLHMLD